MSLGYMINPTIHRYKFLTLVMVLLSHALFDVVNLFNIYMYGMFVIHW